MQEKNEHFSMWAPFRLSMREGYHFIPRGILVQLGYILMKALVILVFRPFNWLFFGTRIRGRENLDAVRGCGVVTVCNHIHPLDCTMVACAARTRKQYFLTIQSIWRSPGAPSGTDFGRCAHSRDKTDARDECRVCREPKGAWCVYPEELGPMMAGSAVLRMGPSAWPCDAGVPIAYGGDLSYPHGAVPPVP
ncbi:MAG: hypothetical protein ACLRVT_01060 [Oscillospiraceae bacterium]